MKVRKQAKHSWKSAASLRGNPRLRGLAVVFTFAVLTFLPGLTQCGETCVEYDENGNLIEFECVTCIERDADPCSIDSWRLPVGSTCALDQQPLEDDGVVCEVNEIPGVCVSGACQLEPAEQAYLKADPVRSGESLGYASAMDGNTLVVGTNAAAADLIGAAYVYVRAADSWAFQTKLVAPSPAFIAQFGVGVDVDGDTIVVGAPGIGTAFVYVRDGTSWTEQARLEGPGFGRSVSISGDTVAVSVPTDPSAATGINGDRNNTNAPGSGAVYVFVRSGTTWTEQAYIKASNAETQDGFGRAVIDGDTLVATSIGEDSAATGVNGDESDNSATFSGAAYVFVRNGTTWSQQAYIKASNTDAQDRFGLIAALSGDTLVATSISEGSAATGINGDDSGNGALESGAAYVFVRTGTTWTQQAYLKASNAQAFDSFGRNVDLSGDKIVVGAYHEDGASQGVNGDQSDNTASQSGAAYVFVRNGTAWTQTDYLKASNTEAGDRFGTSVALSGDSIAVGAVSEASGFMSDQADNSSLDSGAIYVFGAQ